MDNRPIEKTNSNVPPRALVPKNWKITEDVADNKRKIGVFWSAGGPVAHSIRATTPKPGDRGSNPAGHPNDFYMRLNTLVHNY